MEWNVLFDPEFVLEFAVLPDEVKIEILARAELLKLRGAALGTSVCGHFEWFKAREHEGTSLHSG